MITAPLQRSLPINHRWDYTDTLIPRSRIWRSIQTNLKISGSPRRFHQAICFALTVKFLQMLLDFCLKNSVAVRREFHGRKDLESLEFELLAQI